MAERRNMVFKKSEKRRHPHLFMTIGALALVGAVSIKKMGYACLKKKWNKLMGTCSCNAADDASV